MDKAWMSQLIREKAGTITSCLDLSHPSSMRLSDIRNRGLGDESSKLTVYLTFVRDLSKSQKLHGQRASIKEGAFLPLPTHENSVLSKGQVFLGSP